MKDTDLLEDLLDAWEESRENGTPLTVDDLCKDAPHLRERLQEQMARLQSFDNHVDPSLVQTVANSAPPYPFITAEMKLDDLELIGEGKLGAVYSAFDPKFHRRVAVKFLRMRWSGDERIRTDFAREAEVTSRLDHPGVVPVLASGETSDDQRLFYVMRLVDGRSLESAIEKFHSEYADFEHRQFVVLLQQFVTICKTIAYAHTRGIVHRDIKPENVMLGRYGETLVVDWGLAVFKDDQSERVDIMESLRPITSSDPRETSRRAGTPVYMAPEQFELSPRLNFTSDVYSLGAVLYRILTNELPVLADNFEELRQRKLSGNVPSCRSRNAAVPKALNAICMRALESRPQDRYASAMMLAEDIERYLADEPAHAYREPAGEKVVRWVRHHRAAAGVALSGIVAVLLVSVVFSLWLIRSSHSERQARELGIVSRSTLAAESLAWEMQRRFWALEMVAQDSDFKSLLKSCYDAPQDKQHWRAVNDWLLDKANYCESHHGIRTYTWFVNLNDGKGTQIARAPDIDDKGKPFRSLGRSYASRDYFHGRGPQPQDTIDQRPIRTPHLSSPFLGTHGKFVLAFSMPVFGETSDQPLGVVGMAVQLGNMTQIRQAPELTLAYAKPVYFDTMRIEPGLIMQHKAYQPGTVRHLAAADLTSLAKSGKSFDSDYRDPMSQADSAFEGSWLAGMAVVTLDDSFKIGDTGWIVIVQERP